MNKKIVLIIIILSFSMHLFSQVRLNYSKDEIVEEFAEYGTTKVTEEDTRYILVTNLSSHSDVVIIHQIDKEVGVSKLGIIIPLSGGMLHLLIENYNKQYVIISKSEWVAYLGGEIITIKVEKDDEVGFVIVWSIVE